MIAPLGLTEDCKPILRWAGSKRTAASTLGALWDKRCVRYIEPFCGSAALFFLLKPIRAMLSDINKDLIYFYKMTSTYPEEIYDRFVKIPREKTAYYEIRELYREVGDCSQRAAYFYYLNRNCFNGLYRTSKSGNFNVPFADRRVARYPTRDEFLKACEILATAQFECGDFVDLVSQHVTTGDFVYLDPPYASSKRLPFKEYYPCSFDVGDLSRLSALLEEIHRRGAYFVLSYDDSADIGIIAERWSSARYSIRRNISGFAGARRTSNEQIITNCKH